MDRDGVSILFPLLSTSLINLRIDSHYTSTLSFLLAYVLFIAGLQMNFQGEGAQVLYLAPNQLQKSAFKEDPFFVESQIINAIVNFLLSV